MRRRISLRLTVVLVINLKTDIPRADRVITWVLAIISVESADYSVNGLINWIEFQVEFNQ